MVEIKLEKGWYLIHKNKQWMVTKKRKVMQKKKEPKELIKLYKASSFRTLESALNFYIYTTRLEDVSITTWEELKEVYKEGNNLIKRWMEELNG